MDLVRSNKKKDIFNLEKLHVRLDQNTNQQDGLVLSFIPDPNWDHGWNQLW